MRTIDKIVNHFGGVQEMADWLVVNPRTVYTWRRRGYTPDKFDLRLVRKIDWLTIEALANARKRGREAQRAERAAAVTKEDAHASA